MKKITALLLALVLLFSLSACSGTSNEDNAATDSAAATTDSADDTTEVPTLSLLMFTDWYKAGWEALEQYIDENAETLGFRLDIDVIAGGTEGNELLLAKFATGDLPDLLQTYGSVTLDTQWGVLDQMVPLENVDMSEYSQAQLEEGNYIYKGSLYGVPMDSTTLFGVFYNKSVFEAAGIESVPTTWDGFLNCCELLKAYGVTPLYYSGADTWTLQIFSFFGFTQDFLNGGLSYTEYWEKMNTNQMHFTDAAYFADSIALSKELIEDGYVNETYLSDTYDTAQTALVEGTAGMYINGTWVYDEIADKYPEAAENIGSFVLPLNDVNYTCTSLPYFIGMTEACEDQELGEKALNFIASSEAQQIYANAQPGVYLNQNVISDLPEAYQSLYDMMLNGDSMLFWQAGTIYSFGDFPTHLQDYLAGGMSLEDVIQLMDDATAESAVTAGDTNWS